MTRPYLISVDLGDVAGPALDKMVTYRKSDRSDVIRECILLCYNFGLLKRFEGALRKAEKEKSPNVTKKPARPATDEEKMVVEKWREVFNFTGNIHWPKVLRTIREALTSGVTYQDQMDILELAGNDEFIGIIMSRGELPGIPLILGDSMLAKFVPMLEQVRSEMLVKHEANLDGLVKPRAIAKLKEVLTGDAMSKAYDLIMMAKTEEQVEGVVKSIMEAQMEDYETSLEGAVSGWKDKTDGVKN